MNSFTMLYPFLIIYNLLFFGMEWILSQSGASAFISVLTGGVVLILVTAFFGNTARLENKRLYNLAIFVFSLLNCALSAKVATICIGDYFYKEAKEGYILLVICLLSFACLRTGSGAVKTVGGIFGALTVALVAFLGISCIKYAKPQRLDGVFLSGKYFALPFIALCSNLIFCNSHKKSRIKTLLVATVTALFFCIIVSMCFPEGSYGRGKLLLSYRMADMAGLGIIFQRSGVLLIICWLFSAFISSGWFLTRGAMCLEKVFSFKDIKGISPLCTLLVYAVSSCISKNFAERGWIYLMLAQLAFLAISYVASMFVKGDIK